MTALPGNRVVSLTPWSASTVHWSWDALALEIEFRGWTTWYVLTRSWWLFVRLLTSPALSPFLLSIVPFIRSPFFIRRHQRPTATTREFCSDRPNLCAVWSRRVAVWRESGQVHIGFSISNLPTFYFQANPASNSPTTLASVLSLAAYAGVCLRVYLRVPILTMSTRTDAQQAALSRGRFCC